MNFKGWGHYYEDVVRGGTAQLHILITACQADFNPDRSNKVFALQSYNRNPKKFSPDVSGTTLSTSLHVKGELHFCYLDLTIIHICMQICPPPPFSRFLGVSAQRVGVSQAIYHFPYPISHLPFSICRNSISPHRRSPRTPPLGNGNCGPCATVLCSIIVTCNYQLLVIVIAFKIAIFVARLSSEPSFECPFELFLIACLRSSHGSSGCSTGFGISSI